MKKYLLTILVFLGLVIAGVATAAVQKVYIGAIGSNSDAALLWDSTNHRLSVNSTTPAATLAVQGSSTAPSLPIFNIASSSKVSYLLVASNGSTTLSSLNSGGFVKSTATGALFNDASSYITSVVADSPLGGNGTSGSHLTCASCVTNVTGSGNIASSAGTTPNITFTGVLAVANGGTGTSTAPTTQGQILADDGTHKYGPTTLVAGTNITIATTTPGQITIALGGTSLSGSGTNGQVAYYTAANTLASATSLLNNGTVAGVNATSSTINFNVQGTGTNNPFNIASSSGTSYVTVTSNGNVGIGTTTPSKLFELFGAQAGGVARITRDGGLGIVTGQIFGTYDIAAYSASSTIDWPNLTGVAQTFSIATSTMRNIIGDIAVVRNSNDTSGLMQLRPYLSGSAISNAILTLDGFNGTSGINTSTPSAKFSIQGTSAQSYPLFNVASSSATSVFSVLASGNVQLTPVVTSTPFTIYNPSGQISLQLDQTAANVNFAVGTSSNASVIIVQGASASTMPLLTLASSTGTSLLTFDSQGHLGFAGTAPTLSSCNTGTVLANSTDVSGAIIPGAAQTTCTINFATPRTNIPFCVITQAVGSAVTGLEGSSTKTTLVVTGTTIGGDTITYFCPGN